MIINKLKKINILVFLGIVFTSMFLQSCGKRLDNAYNSSRLLNNLYVANDSTFADGTAKKIVVPDLLENSIVENVGAEGYFVASTNRFSSNFTRYHNPYRKLPMASLTKLMTALIVLENCTDLEQKYYVSMDAVDFDKDASKANLKAGDYVKVKDLLYGLLMPSGNDAAYCLAENLVNSYDNFIIMMNNEAERLGAINSHFANPHGLDSEYHYTTAYDLFLITRELSKYKLFKEITTTKDYTATIYQADGSSRTETWENTNFFVTGELPISSNVEMLAGKTGNTTNAGNCLVILSKDKKTNDEYISVVLNAKSKRNTYYNTNALLAAIPSK